MTVTPHELRNLNDLRTYVRHTLCDQNELEPTAFPVSERILVRSGRPCGIFFCVHGPRSVRLTAVWETDRNTILFYNSSGQRTLKTQVEASLRLEPVPT